GIAAGVEVREAFDALVVTCIVGSGQCVEVERGQRFAGVLPIERRDELAPVHAARGHLDLWDLRLSELLEMSFPGLLIKAQHVLVAACFWQLHLAHFGILFWPTL